MSRSVKYSVSLRMKVPAKYQRGSKRVKYWRGKALDEKKKQMDKDLFTLWNDPFDVGEIMNNLLDKLLLEEPYGYY